MQFILDWFPSHSAADPTKFPNDGGLRVWDLEFETSQKAFLCILHHVEVTILFQKGAINEKELMAIKELLK